MVHVLSFQTDGSGQHVHSAPSSGCILFTVQSSSFGHIMVKQHYSNFRIITAIFWMSEFFGLLQ